MTPRTRDFGYNLRLLRHRAGITQTDLAARADCTGSAISTYESGSKMPGLSVALRLAEALNISLDTLCGERMPPC